MHYCSSKCSHVCTYSSTSSDSQYTHRRAQRTKQIFIISSSCQSMYQATLKSSLVCDTVQFGVLQQIFNCIEFVAFQRLTNMGQSVLQPLLRYGCSAACICGDSSSHNHDLHLFPGAQVDPTTLHSYCMVLARATLELIFVFLVLCVIA
jgi:hypothetical protein